MFRYAFCNETFEGWDHERVCACVASHGYQGLEMAPFTLAPLITDVPPERRRELRRAAQKAGLQIIGLHWLLAKTEGFQVTSADEAVRARTADYLVALARGCADLGGDLMVFGSPGQRRIPAGATYAEALDWAADTFRRAMPGIAPCGVRVCLEPLSPPEADFINTAAEAIDLLRLVDHPQFVLHLDVKAMATEDATVPQLIARHSQQLGHFHANDVNRRGPGFGDTEFTSILSALRQAKYDGWVSVEVFDYVPDPETIARESIRYLRECETRAERLEKTVSQYLGSKPR